MNHQKECKFSMLLLKVRQAVYDIECLLYTARFTQANWKVPHNRGNRGNWDNNGYIFVHILDGWYKLIAIEMFGLLFDTSKKPKPLFVQLHKFDKRGTTITTSTTSTTLGQIWTKLGKYKTFLKRKRLPAAHPKYKPNRNKSKFKNPLVEVLQLMKEYLSNFEEWGQQCPNKFYVGFANKDRRIVAHYIRGYAKTSKKVELNSQFLW